MRTISVVAVAVVVAGRNESSWLRLPTAGHTSSRLKLSSSGGSKRRTRRRRRHVQFKKCRAACCSRHRPRWPGGLGRAAESRISLGTRAATTRSLYFLSLTLARPVRCGVIIPSPAQNSPCIHSRAALSPYHLHLLFNFSRRLRVFSRPGHLPSFSSSRKSHYNFYVRVPKSSVPCAFSSLRGYLGFTERALNDGGLF